ncbi:hypothetical protein GCM10027039_29060 [Terrabacter koreensis]
MPFIAGTVAFVSAAPVYLHRDASSVLTNLLPGWDNAAHFWMFSSVLRNGATMDVVQPPVDDAFAFAGYPQAFHATLASVATLWWPDSSVDASSLLLLYGRSCAALIALGTTVLIAGVTSLSKVRRCPLLALPLGALLTAALSLGPGLMLHLNGFSAFWFPCALASCVPLVAARWETPQQTAHAVAVFGALVGVAHGWLPLLTLAGPILLYVSPRLFRERHAESAWQRVSLAVAAVAALVGLIRALGLLSQVGVAALAIPGAIPPTTLEFNLLLLAATATALYVAFRRQAREAVAGDARSNVNAMRIALASGLLAAILIAIVQRANGAFPGYYFWKYLTGYQLFMFTLIATSLGSSQSNGPTRVVRGRNARACLAVLSATAAFVATATPNGSPSTQSATHFEAVQRVTGAGTNLLRAATLPDTCKNSAFMATDNSMNIMHGHEWFLALRNAWTVKNDRFPPHFTSDAIDRHDRLKLAASWLEDDQRCLIVAPASWSGLASNLPPTQVARLLTW